jgi:uncharacterized Fe-S cluster-containing radical SAM superfamily protein
MPDSPALTADLELPGTARTFSTGLLLDIIQALRSTPPGGLVAFTTIDPSVESDLDTWSRLTGHAIVGVTRTGGATRWVLRHGPAAMGEPGTGKRLTDRLWLYTNFDCNLRCDYCCVRSSPTADRRELGLERVRRIAAEASALGVQDFFITGGEPFLLHDIALQVQACAVVAPTTVLTNGMLFAGPRRAALRALPRDRVALQISLDSPTPELHDRHRGAGSWARALDGIRVAREEGFRVRIAATVAGDAEARAFEAFLDERDVAAQDRVVRRVALRGFAVRGVALARADLVPEVTITAAGVYWHPVGADDADMLATPEIFPLTRALEEVRQQLTREQSHADRLMQVFHCA